MSYPIELNPFATNYGVKDSVYVHPCSQIKNSNPINNPIKNPFNRPVNTMRTYNSARHPERQPVSQPARQPVRQPAILFHHSNECVNSIPEGDEITEGDYESLTEYQKKYFEVEDLNGCQWDKNLIFTKKPKACDNITKRKVGKTYIESLPKGSKVTSEQYKEWSKYLDPIYLKKMFWKNDLGTNSWDDSCEYVKC